MIWFKHIFNDVGNYCTFNIITSHLNFEYTIYDVKNLKALRDNLNEVIKDIEEVEQLSEKERMQKWCEEK